MSDKIIKPITPLRYMEHNQQNPPIGFYTDDYYEFLLQAAQAESQGLDSKLEEGIQLFEKYIGKEQVEKDYHTAVNFWKTIESERLQNIETRGELERSEMDNHNDELRKIDAESRMKEIDVENENYLER